VYLFSKILPAKQFTPNQDGRGIRVGNYLFVFDFFFFCGNFLIMREGFLGYFPTLLYCEILEYISSNNNPTSSCCVGKKYCRKNDPV